MTVTIDKISIKCDTCGQVASWGGTPKENVPVTIATPSSTYRDIELVAKESFEGWEFRPKKVSHKEILFNHICPACVLENGLKQVNTHRVERGLKPLVKETA